MTYAIECHDINFKWPGSNSPVLDISEFNVERGERLFLYGASGSGKSTLLSLIAGLLPSKEGGIHVLEQDMSKMGDRAKDRFRAKHIGFVFQQFNLIPYLDVESNIGLAASLAGLSKIQTKQRTLALLDALLIDPRFLSQRADKLSIGQQQRVAVARALINEPEVLIADEPTSSLDEEAKDEFIELLLRTQQRTGASVIFVSHDRSLMKHFDRTQNMTDINRVLAHRGSHVI
mgnify:FL=1|tara:strand:- start:1088 stop:1783 length:696 start_codon:yes stop_codon:yes gene_type:complete